MLALVAGRVGAQLPLPPPPADGAFITDLAGLLHDPEINRIGAAQHDAWTNHGIPIIVVTIPSMRVYGHTGSIEDFAARWFNHWGIGSSEDGKNNGILVMVSVGDRKARIELGAAWGRGWDDHCRRIMERVMIPEFKKGGYSTGIAAGVEEWARMAAQGPGAAPPAPGIVDQARTALGSDRPAAPTTPFPPLPVTAMVGVGLLLIVGSFFAPENMRRTLLIGGIVLVVLGLFFWAVLFLVLLWAKFSGGGRSRESGWSGGGFSSGGGFGGGFSGGGGASGSW
jgi:uncharacterized protein